MLATQTTEHSLKHAQLISILEQYGVDGVLLSTPATIAWYLAGARTHVSLAGPPIARVLVHRNGCEIATSISEAARLGAEELSAAPEAALHVLDWHASLDDLQSWYPQAAGLKIASEAELEPELQKVRSVLNEAEVDRYRTLCQDTAAIFTDVLATATREETEFELAARLSAAAIAQGGEVLVALVSGESRGLYRHPVPTHAPLGRRAMAVLCVRRHGLIANVTRWVRFGAPLPGELEAEAGILAVEADIIAAFTPGKELKDVLPALVQAYPDHGFDEQEWTRHHQGGIAGYNGRDPRLSPTSAAPVQLGQSFAFNPTAVRDGLAYKVEDTLLLTGSADAPVVEVLSIDPRWPSTTVNGLVRPAVLQLD